MVPPRCSGVATPVTTPERAERWWVAEISQAQGISAEGLQGVQRGADGTQRLRECARGTPVQQAERLRVPVDRQSTHDPLRRRLGDLNAHALRQRTQTAGRLSQRLQHSGVKPLTHARDATRAGSRATGELPLSHRSQWALRSPCEPLPGGGSGGAAWGRSRRCARVDVLRAVCGSRGSRGRHCRGNRRRGGGVRDDRLRRQTVADTHSL